MKKTNFPVFTGFCRPFCSDSSLICPSWLILKRICVVFLCFLVGSWKFASIPSWVHLWKISRSGLCDFVIFLSGHEEQLHLSCDSTRQQYICRMFTEKYVCFCVRFGCCCCWFCFCCLSIQLVLQVCLFCLFLYVCCRYVATSNEDLQVGCRDCIHTHVYMLKMFQNQKKNKFIVYDELDRVWLLMGSICCLYLAKIWAYVYGRLLNTALL